MPLDSYESWDFLIDELRSIEGLSSLQKKPIKEAFRFLQDELGDGFPKRIMKERHPFAYQFINRAPWTRIWLAWFATALKTLKKQEKYNSLLKRMKNTTRLLEGLTVLRVSYKLVKGGFNILFDPEVVVDGRPKEPDLKISRMRECKIFVEVSAMKTAYKKQKAFETGFKISERITRAHPRVLYSGRIYKIVDNNEILKIAEIVEGLGSKANAENEMQVLCLEDKIKVAVAPQSKESVIDDWAKKNGFEVNNILWPIVRSNEIERTKRKIRTKNKQLPKEHLNMIVIIKNDWYWENLFVVIGELKKEFPKYQNLFAVAILSEYLDQIETKVRVVDNSAIYQKQLFDMVAERGIVMFSDKIGINVGGSVATRILQAFIEF